MKIAIVGAGPVGLTSAISLIYNKLSNKSFPKYDITIYEKRTKYTREQFIVSGGNKGDILKNYPPSLRKKIQNNISCYIDNPVHDISGYCLKNKSDFYKLNYTIQIKKLEKILFEYIKKKKEIKIIKKEFTKKDIDNYDVIIGADGSNSFVREKLMKSKWINLKNYESYILHINYTDLSNKKYKINISPNKFYDTYEIRKRKENIFSQDRFRLIRSDTNKSQFLLQINKLTYNKIKNIKTFKELPKKLQQIFHIDTALMGSVPSRPNKINVYVNNVGHSLNYSIIKNKKLFILIGDSAQIKHIFTGEGLNIEFGLLRNAIKNFSIKKNTNNYNNVMDFNFRIKIQNKAFQRYVPFKILKNICSKIKLEELIKVLRVDFYIKGYKEIIEKLGETIPNNVIKNELCYVFRDILFKYYTYRIDKK